MWRHTILIARILHAYRGMAPPSLVASLVASLVFAPPAALADSGASNERVSSPDGPGSVGGAGENLSASGNMGAMSYSVPLEVPEGFTGATPDLALSYSSMQGSGPLGIGWQLPIPYIERFTLRGLPHYDTRDVFAADGSEELVRVRSGPDERVYRARFEGSFVRYSWHVHPAGRAGYWVAEYPNGSRAFFGAYEQNDTVVEVPESLNRASDDPDAGVFRYMLVKTEDSFGHAVRYHYKLDHRTPLLDRVEYLYAGSPSSTTDPRYVVQLGYEKRGDELTSSLAGFESRLHQRLATVEVRSLGTLLRRYALDYEQATAGTSRLRRVRQYGLEGRELLPLMFAFEYSSSLQLGCSDCKKPFVFGMGTLSASSGGGIDLKNGRATLIDINGDALPDLLDTSNGQHRFYLNQMQPDGSQSFSAPRASHSDTSGFWLEQASVQTLDVNGDGFVDVANALTGQVLCNRGLGDWTTEHCPSIEFGGVVLHSDDGDADPKGIRFLDANGDRRIDTLQAGAGSTQLWLRTETGYSQAPAPDALEFGFDDGSQLQLADINGDGLLDAAKVDSRLVWYRLHLGSGKFAEARSAPLTWKDASEATDVELELWDLQDLNGDGLDDVVAVVGSRVYVALQHAGEFLPLDAIGSSDLGSERPLPFRHADTTVLFADMNGSGTTDVVWVAPDDGSVHVLELFAVRPNLLTHISNGLGSVQTVEYGTSVREQACDEASDQAPLASPYCQHRTTGGPWKHRLPQATNLVTATEQYTTLNPDLPLRLQYSYHHGFYDGAEKRYRGFAEVEERSAADATQEGSLRVMEYDVGDTDPHHAGLLMREQTFGENQQGRYPLQEVRYGYERCEVAQAESFDAGYPYPVGYACEVSQATTLKEGRLASEWVTLLTERRYDDYGNVTLDANLGVVPSEVGACEPCTAPPGTFSGACGPECHGDEEYVATEYVDPRGGTAGRWNLGSAYRSRRYSVANDKDLAETARGARFAETLIYYDGEPFVGQPSGLTQGLVTRVCQRVTPEAQDGCQGRGWVQSQRVEHDGAHGNVVAELDPLGSPGDVSGHRRAIAYDEYHLKPTTFTVYLGRGGQPYQLTRTLHYDPVFYRPDRVGRWQLANASVTSKGAETLFDYDDFGRPSKIVAPGDTLQAPTQQITYELGAPVSRIVVRGRSESGQAMDLERLQCLDGLGRTVQSRTRVEEGRYQVGGFDEMSYQGGPVRAYQPYEGGRDCDTSAPQRVLFTRTFYDAAGRPLRVTEPDGDIHGAASETTFDYGPLVTTAFDPGDNNADNPVTFNTPHRLRIDGLGRLITLERSLSTAGEAGRVRALWAELDHFSGYLDPGQNRKHQTYDLLGRVLEVRDPNAGRTLFEYDVASNLVSHTDARGRTVRSDYDGANRLLARYEPDRKEATLETSHYDFAVDCEACSHAEGLLVQQSYPLDTARGRDEFGYDVRDQQTHFARSLHGQRFVLGRVYDNAGRGVVTTFPDGSQFRPRFDAASRLIALGGVLDAVGYGSQGLHSEITYANGVRSLQTYDTRLRLRSLRTLDAQENTLQGMALTRDRNANVETIADLTDARQGRLDSQQTLQHDAWHRTTRVFFGSSGETLQFRFDALDNLTHKISSLAEQSPAHLGRSLYDSARPNALQSAGLLDQSYDEAGRVRRLGDVLLDWDAQGRLSRTESPDGRVGAYFYSQGVERVFEQHGASRTYYIGTDFEIRDGVAFTYARLGRDRVARLATTTLGSALLGDPSGNGRVDVGDAWLERNHAATLLRGAARRMLAEAEGGPVFLHHDLLGSLTLATDAEGTLRGERTFYPTGQARGHRGFVDDYGFTGQRVDVTTGLTHFLYRELDTRTGRWTSPDPLFTVATQAGLARLGEATTAYAYVAGTLSSVSDPTGLVGSGLLSADGSPQGTAARFPLEATISPAQIESDAKGRIPYFTASERQQYRLEIRDGHVFQQGQPFVPDPKNNSKLRCRVADPNWGQAKYVMDRAGQFYAFHPPYYSDWPGKPYHSSLLAGGPVAAAGLMHLEVNALRAIDNSSGHYRTTEQHLAQASDALRLLGLHVSAPQRVATKLHRVGVRKTVQARPLRKSLSAPF